MNAAAQLVSQALRNSTTSKSIRNQRRKNPSQIKLFGVCHDLPLNYIKFCSTNVGCQLVTPPRRIMSTDLLVGSINPSGLMSAYVFLIYVVYLLCFKIDVYVIRYLFGCFSFLFVFLVFFWF